MSLFDYVMMFVAAYSSVFLLGLQSKNVQASRIAAAIYTSIGISISQFIFVKYSATGSLLAMVCMTAGGALGIASSIYIHDRFYKCKSK